MTQSILVVLSNPVSGRDDDFNDWYTHIHFHDALSFRGVIGAQRFRLSDHQIQHFPEGFVAGYLALYEVSDAARFTREHVEALHTVRMKIGDSFDTGRVDDYYYYLLQSRDRNPLTAGEGSVMLEQINVAIGSEAAFEAWYNNTYLPEMIGRDGVTAAMFLRFETDGQMMPGTASHRYVGIYRLTDPAARQHWQGGALAASPLVDASTLAVTCWDLLTRRFTADEIAHPTSTLLAAGEAARIRMGDRIHHQLAELTG